MPAIAARRPRSYCNAHGDAHCAPCKSRFFGRKSATCAAASHLARGGQLVGVGGGPVLQTGIDAVGLVDVSGDQVRLEDDAGRVGHRRGIVRGSRMSHRIKQQRRGTWSVHVPAQGEDGADCLVLLLKEHLGQEPAHHGEVLARLLGLETAQLQRNGCRTRPQAQWRPGNVSGQQRSKAGIRSNRERTLRLGLGVGRLQLLLERLHGGALAGQVRVGRLRVLGPGGGARSTCTQAHPI